MRAQNKLIKSFDSPRYQMNRSMKSKIFSQISDHQQSMAPRPLRGAIRIPPALLVIAGLVAILSGLFG
jgi:hypothetical protein